MTIEPLDVRFAEVHLERVPIQDAIDHIATEVRQVYGSRYFFSPAFQRATDPMMKAPLPNPPVTFHGADVSAREVFSSICQQVGWSYEWNVKHNIMFQDGPGLGRPRAHTMRSNQSMQPTAGRSMLHFMKACPFQGAPASASGG
jgi:hypothetical protein